jgi:hypothetical protein
MWLHPADQQSLHELPLWLLHLAGLMYLSLNLFSQSRIGQHQQMMGSNPVTVEMCRHPQRSDAPLPFVQGEDAVEVVAVNHFSFALFYYSVALLYMLY